MTLSHNFHDKSICSVCVGWWIVERYFINLSCLLEWLNCGSNADLIKSKIQRIIIFCGIFWKCVRLSRYTSSGSRGHVKECQHGGAVTRVKCRQCKNLFSWIYSFPPEVYSKKFAFLSVDHFHGIKIGMHEFRFPSFVCRNCWNYSQFQSIQFSLWKHSILKVRQ